MGEVELEGGEMGERAAKAGDDGSNRLKAGDDILDFPALGDDRISLTDGDGLKFESQDPADFHMSKRFR